MMPPGFGREKDRKKGEKGATSEVRGRHETDTMTKDKIDKL
jgi:hypothetical protein